MHKQSRIASAFVFSAMTVAVCSAQSVTSAHSGTLHYFQGDVSIDGAPVEAKVGKFSEVKEQSILRTSQGRAEVLLTPGVFLRVGENTAIKMLDNRLLSTRVEILSGSAIVESDDPQMSVKDSPVSLIYKDYEIRMVKHGLVEIESDPAQMKVYKGEAVVTTASDRATVKEGHLLPFSAALLTESFNDKVGDDLYIWARDRSQSISAANMSSARSLNPNGYGSGYGYGNGYSYGSGYGYGNGYGLGSGAGAWNGGWYFNPYFDMFTFVPAYGTLWNPWGYGFFSPGTIYNYYTPTTYWYGGGGARGTGSIGRSLSGIATNTSTTQRAPLAGLFPRSGGVSGVNSPIRGVGAATAGAGSASLARSGVSSGFSGGGLSGGRVSGGTSGSGHGGGGRR
ncbi:MAG TPA: hypothetical protein VHY84_23930 [Bryobacteraceae bacterium]|nr:hypothetical protein [Bryobacteraceae bacterium]